MQIIADLHVHSKYSRAVSPQMNLTNMADWAVKKGINLLGTGDFTHPLWFREIKANLEEISEGIYGLRAPIAVLKNKPSFLLSSEISSIYSQGGKVRRIHNVVLSPSVETVDKINNELIKRGCNLHSDGRPIIGMSARDLIKLVLEIDERCLFIPAHVWTPWFSIYGSQSGFDSLDECFGEMAKYIYAVETGLSSDPAMNWRIKELENRSILSNSDAHSGAKLGREATVFEMEEVSYENIRKAIINGCHSERSEESQGDPSAKPQDDKKNRISHTLEFYPEEGKYHYTGHRDCNIKQSPEETLKSGEICSVCGKKLTIGVEHRVQQLAQREFKVQSSKFKVDENGVRWISQISPIGQISNRPPYVMLVPLQEIIAEALGTATASIKVQNEYEKLIEEFGGIGEFGVLLKTPIEEIAKISGEKIGEGVRRVRAGEISVDPGYDGVFGTVRIWGNGGNEGIKGDEGEEKKEQMSMF